MSGLNRDDILRMAREVAGVTYPAGMAEVKIGMSEEHLERFAALVAAAEREACAKLCEQPIDEIQITDDCSELVYMGGKECAFAIRERGAP